MTDDVGDATDFKLKAMVALVGSCVRQFDIGRRGGSEHLEPVVPLGRKH
jgi:hypothetical protein